MVVITKYNQLISNWLQQPNLEERRRDMKNNLAEIRKNRGYTQMQLAEILGISHWWLNNIETGRNRPSLHLVSKISKILNVNYTINQDDLFFED